MFLLTCECNFWCRWSSHVHSMHCFVNSNNKCMCCAFACVYLSVRRRSICGIMLWGVRGGRRLIINFIARVSNENFFFSWKYFLLVVLTQVTANELKLMQQTKHWISFLCLLQLESIKFIFNQKHACEFITTWNFEFFHQFFRCRAK